MISSLSPRATVAESFVSSETGHDSFEAVWSQKLLKTCALSLAADQSAAVLSWLESLSKRASASTHFRAAAFSAFFLDAICVW